MEGDAGVIPRSAGEDTGFGDEISAAIVVVTLGVERAKCSHHPCIWRKVTMDRILLRRDTAVKLVARLLMTGFVTSGGTSTVHVHIS